MLVYEKLSLKNAFDVILIPVRLILTFIARPVRSLLMFVPDMNHFTFKQTDTPN